MNVLLALLLRNEGSLVLGESSADGTGVLWSEVEREVLLALVEETQLSALVGLDDGQDAGNGLAKIVTVQKIPSSALFCSPFFICVVFPPESILCMQA